MCPNIFSCDPKWLDHLKEGQENVVVVGYCGGDEKCNAFIEEVAKLEKEGIPVFILDKDSCPDLAAKVGLQNPGDTVIYSKGVESGRLTPADVDTAVAQIKQAMKGEPASA